MTAFACLGTSSTMWNGFSLPIDLAKLGLPGCRIFADLSVSFARQSSSTGTAELRVTVPPDGQLAGATLFGQWIVQDLRVNPNVAIAVSDGLRFTLGSEPAPLVTSMSAAGTLANGGSGFVQLNHGLVVALRW